MTAPRYGAFSGVASASCRVHTMLRRRDLIEGVYISELLSQCKPQCC